MKHIILIGLIAVVGVGALYLLPWKSWQSDTLVEGLPEASQKKSPVKEMLQPSVARSSKSDKVRSADESGRSSGMGGSAVPFAGPPKPSPLLSGTSSGVSNANETTPGSSVAVEKGASPLGNSVVSGGTGFAGGEADSTPVNAVGSGAIAGNGYPKAMAPEISIPVPEGAKVPALFYDNEQKPIPQQKALDKIAREFEANVSEIPAGMTKEEVWEAARKFADESYLILFGYQAYNQYHIQAAKEALREKRQREQGRAQ
jgi:hypothetical protein